MLNDTVLDVNAGTLTRAAKLVALRQKSFLLLGLLAGKAGQVVTKDELLDAIWPDVTVTEDSLTQAIRDVRTALADTDATLIRTIRGRGYLMDLPPDSAVQDGNQPSALPRVLVMPFLQRPYDAKMALRIDALAEDVASGLTRYRTLRVVSTVSARGALLDGRDAVGVAQLLRADYVIEGTAFYQDDKLTLRLSLTEIASFEQVWRETLDCTGDAILSAWDRIVARVVGHIVNGIEVEGHRHGSSAQTSNLTAYDHRARGLALWTSDDVETAQVCLGHFKAAVKADPGFALAWTHMAWAELTVHEYALAPADVRERTLEYARHAVTLAPFDGRTHSGLGYIQVICGHFAQAEANARFGLQLNPSSVECLFDYAVIVMNRGRAIEVIGILDEVADLCPLRIAYDAPLRGQALFMAGRYCEAVDAFLQIPKLSLRRRVFLGAMLAKAGRTDDAKAIIQAVVAEQPDMDHIDIMRRGYTLEHAHDRQHLMDAVALAFDLAGVARP
ncbi:winged helix-turn-helix domain-containing tetratricopeptide repeat protein [Yoonia vestfoldensis]|uniref:winged helix-turn-helix domain-containing tetratricopeptide repeat protein n=1 Tax=Yoonia vestfoldensis TaxID=245188 RepID=UPI000363C9C7|nr:winged helix-turn-helix domain-containing protein [Yoonia vestfoldensis]